MKAMLLVDKSLRYYLKMNGAEPGSSTGTERPEIDRYELRRMLLDSLRPGTVRWSCRLRTAEETKEGISLHFDHGVETGFNLVIGADRAWSKIRTLLTEEKPVYSGIAGFQWSLPDAEKNHPILSKLVNRGSLFSFSNGKSIIVQQLGTGALGVSAWWIQPEDYLTSAKYDIQNVDAVRSMLLEEFNDWNPYLKAFVEKLEGTDLVSRALYMLPVGVKWIHKSGITLIGDAAHLMTPFAGEGVNVAMKDAVDLAEAIIVASKTQFGDISQRIESFEQSMFKRASKVQQLTLDMMNYVYFTPGAPYTSIERYISRAMSDHVHPVLFPAVASIVYIIYFFWKHLGFGRGLEKSLKE
jgi:2-polyprenyl-6-methoxyphenol hydroxylase-like FAD-dependent oxidoreductase